MVRQWEMLGKSDLRVSISSTRYVLPDASVSCDPGDLEGENDIIYSPRLGSALLILWHGCRPEVPLQGESVVPVV